MDGIEAGLVVGACLGVVALAGAALYREVRRRAEERTAALLEDFERRFPGRCPICSHHRWGRLHGCTRRLDPPPHPCIERGGEEVGSNVTTQAFVTWSRWRA